MLVIGSDINLPAVLRLLPALADCTPKVRITLLAAPGTRDLEWSLRELGAVDFLAAPVASRDLANVVRREFGLARVNTLAAATHESKPSLSNR